MFFRNISWPFCPLCVGRISHIHTASRVPGGAFCSGGSFCCWWYFAATDDATCSVACFASRGGVAVDAVPRLFSALIDRVSASVLPRSPRLRDQVLGTKLDDFVEFGKRLEGVRMRPSSSCTVRVHLLCSFCSFSQVEKVAKLWRRVSTSRRTLFSLFRLPRCVLCSTGVSLIRSADVTLPTWNANPTFPAYACL